MASELRQHGLRGSQSLCEGHRFRARKGSDEELKRNFEPTLLAFFLLSGCGGAGPECGSLAARASVVKIVSDDNNNALANYAARNSSVVEAKAENARTETERSEIRKIAAQAASYALDDAIRTNSTSKDKRSAMCSGLLSATVDDATAQKQVDFKVEKTPDGKVSVSVSPFQF